MKNERLAVNAIRILSADMIQKANSGHPGMPLGAASMTYELWMNHMRHNPANPKWINRDRFVLSSGHASAMLYSLLHLTGYGLTIEDLKQFRQMDSKTPGHPEYGHTQGVEATTGPLGAGMGMAVGMAIAEAHLAAVFNKPGFPIIDHYTYVLGGDGCMMEGISSEAFSLAGTLGLGKLIVLYDSNGISIEGGTEIAFAENVGMRMEAFGFQVLTVSDGNNLKEIGEAIECAKKECSRPSFIIVKTEIGYGCPEKQGSAKAHGEPLGTENVQTLRKTLNWEREFPFDIPKEVYEHYKRAGEEGAALEQEWKNLLKAYIKKYPEMKGLWRQYFEMTPIVGSNVSDGGEEWEKGVLATRAVSGLVLNQLKEKIPNLVGGSADLSPSTKTYLIGEGDFSKGNYKGRNLHFGVREIAMAAIGNGMALHGGLRPYVSTFFVFSDYMKPMMRLAALMKLPVIYVLTHDSIGVGEDGPTHQPIEQLAMLRSMPGFYVFRPADARETETAWNFAVTRNEAPTALVLSRQNLPQLNPRKKETILRGGYILIESKKTTPDGIFIATGSEVALAVKAAELLEKRGISIRVVSMPCTELFDEQPEEYRESVLPRKIRNRMAIEAGSNFGWEKYVGLDGVCITMHGFGTSAPANQLFEKYGFTAKHIAESAEDMINKNAVYGR